MPTFQGWAGGVCWHNSCGIHVDLMTLIHPKTLPVGNCSKSVKCGSGPTQKSQWGVRLVGRTHVHG